MPRLAFVIASPKHRLAGWLAGWLAAFIFSLYKINWPGSQIVGKQQTTVILL
jgi:hypothetical protein